MNYYRVRKDPRRTTWVVERYKWGTWYLKDEYLVHAHAVWWADRMARM